jgi:hypothetical protein
MAVKEKKGGGTLNPEWVEWLMGWPIGWTDLKPLEMDRYRQWLQQHSKYLNQTWVKWSGEDNER